MEALGNASQLTCWRLRSRQPHWTALASDPLRCSGTWYSDVHDLRQTASEAVAAAVAAAVETRQSSAKPHHAHVLLSGFCSDRLLHLSQAIAAQFFARRCWRWALLAMFWPQDSLGQVQIDMLCHAGAENLGTWLMLLFFATIGASAGSWSALLASRTIFIFILLQLGIHLLVVLGVGRACKLDMQVCDQQDLPSTLRLKQQKPHHANRWQQQGATLAA